jgi:hypothetical protein
MEVNEAKRPRALEKRELAAQAPALTKRQIHILKE